MPSITDLVPIRIDASSSDGAVRIIDTLLVDTTCLPVAHPVAPRDRGDSGPCDAFVSLSSLIDANATHFAETILADAEVYGAVRSTFKTYMGGRMQLLDDAKLFREVEKQIRTQLGIALRVSKKDLIPVREPLHGETLPTPDGAVSSTSDAQLESGNAGEKGNGEAKPVTSNIVRIKLRLRQENILVVDEFDYDINTSGMEGCDPLTMAESLVEDLKLPHELAPSIAASIVEQIYGLDVSESLGGSFSKTTLRDTPSALVLDVAKYGTSTDFAQIILGK
ncbi:hypothetical protein ACHAWF_003152 [Thalassiosira exigua]